jgi:hypothetical protein
MAVKKPKVPPLSVLPSGAGVAVQAMLAQQRVPVTSRRPAQFRGDGLYGLGTGPPDAGPAPPPVHLPGGDVLTGLKHPAFLTVERLYRKLPEEAMFNPRLSPSKPFEFELGSFRVPDGQQFWFTDYSFSILRQSGVDPGDVVYAEEGRFSGVLGFDVTVTGKRMSDLLYQLDPQPTSLTREQFAPPRATISESNAPDAFDAAAAGDFASTAGPGNSLLPVRPEVQGPRGGPFTMVVHEGQYVTLSAVVFRPVTTPIASIEGRLAGFLIHTNMSETLVNRMRPR